MEGALKHKKQANHKHTIDQLFRSSLVPVCLSLKKYAHCYCTVKPLGEEDKVDDWQTKCDLDLDGCWQFISYHLT